MSLNWLKSFALATGTTLLLGGVSSANAFEIFTDRAAWEAAISEAAISGYTITTDTFSNPILSAQSITLDSGIVSTNSTPPTLPNSFNNNSVSIVNSGVYDNATQAGTGNSASNTITWVFPSAHVFAFGADFISAGLDRLTLIGNFDGKGDQTIVVNNTIGGGTGFLGVVGKAKFSSVVFGNNLTIVDSFSIDNASFAVPKVNVCHATGNGTYRLINISKKAVQSHLAHGDALPGSIVGTSLVGNDCSLKEIQRVDSPSLSFSSTGWGGWSCPAGTTVVGGGYEPADATVLVSEAAKPGSTSGLYPAYPHYTFTPPETGWVVQNGSTPQTLTVYALCVAN